jgi:hypothetical protein
MKKDVNILEIHHIFCRIGYKLYKGGCFENAFVTIKIIVLLHFFMIDWKVL